VEIMSETEADDMLVIDRSQDESKFATTMPAAQRVLEQLGSAQNLQLAKLWHARRCLLVEGKDFRYLSDLFDVLYPDDREGLAAIPTMQIGGWGGWQYAIGSAMLLQNSGVEHIAVYCVLDSDYHTAAQKLTRGAQATRNQINLHIWSRKEIENYLLDSETIAKLSGATPSAIDVMLTESADDLRDHVEGQLVARALKEAPSGVDAATTTTKVLSELRDRWTYPEERIGLIPGKQAIARLNERLHRAGHRTVTARKIAARIDLDTIPEMRDVLIRIDEALS